MKLTQILTNLVVELNLINNAGERKTLFREGDGLPIFSTLENSYAVFFSNASLGTIRKIAKTLYDEDLGISSVTELNNFQKIVRQVVTDLYAENELQINSDDECKESTKNIQDKSKEVLNQLNKDFVHYFPAWTINLMDAKPFLFGAVTVMSRLQWLETVNLHEQLLDRLLSKPEENKLWKENIKQALETKPLPDRAEGDLADDFYKTVKDAPAILKVKVVGYEKELSRKVGQIVCKSTLRRHFVVVG